MPWTNEERLEMIGRVAYPYTRSPPLPYSEVIRRGEAILFLSYESDGFLEKNRELFDELIDLGLNNVHT